MELTRGALEVSPTSHDPEPDRGSPEPPRANRPPEQEARIAALVRDHFDFVWRSLRRQGLPAEAADDAAQQVFLIASRRIADIEVGAERSFLFQTALRVGLDARRAWQRRQERVRSDGDFSELRDSAPSPEDEAHRRRSLELLDEILGSLDEKLRVPFVLFELEGLEVKEIANLLGLPTGTAASRLRAAREEFHAAAKRLRARQGSRRSP
jgi:RNA polymerase sigma-70 factor (ECF subfamily)